jgi:hypothetical protein
MWQNGQVACFWASSSNTADFFEQEGHERKIMGDSSR